MATARTACRLPLPALSPGQQRTWTMPLGPDSFPDRASITTTERAALLEYLDTCVGRGTAWRARRVLAQIERLEQPFGQVVSFIRREFSPRTCTSSIPVFRRLLYRHMAQTCEPFWLWGPAGWQAVHAAMDISAERERYLQHWVGAAAYLFADVLPPATGSITSYSVAALVFGSARMTAEADALLNALRPADAGWSAQHKTDSPFRWFFALAMLVNRSPYLESYGPEALRQLAALHDQDQRLPLRFDALLAQFQTYLCAIGTLEAPLIDLGRRSPPCALDRDLADIDPAWIAWVRAFSDQTPGMRASQVRRSQVVSQALMAGRWLKRFHPTIREPQQWDERLAEEYVAYTCQATCGDLWAPEDRARPGWRRTRDKTLTATAVAGRLGALRVFFHALQCNVYVVDGVVRPKLTLLWVPAHALATPDTIKAGIQPSPRDVASDVWFKLVWAATTLSADDLGVQDAAASSAQRRRPFFPLAYYRAAALLWVTGARRADEIRRLTTGSVHMDIAPEMRDEHGKCIESEEHLCYLRVPANKYGAEFYAPIPAYTAEAIQVWENLRPTNQRTWEDRKTRKQVGYLFSVRDRMMGQSFLNRHLIPLLCRKAGVPEVDAVGRITAHRSRATNAQWLRDMGLSPSDIGRILGHKHPERTLPWYLRESRHRLGRAFRRANPLDRQVAALLDPQAIKRGEPCVFYYLTDGPNGRPRLCGNPDFGACVHQMKCVECETFIDAEQAEIIERRPGVMTIQVAVPLPEHVVQVLEADDDGDRGVLTQTLPPRCPGPAFHFNTAVPLRGVQDPAEERAWLQARLADLTAQVERKRGTADGRNAVVRSLMREVADVEARLARGAAASAPPL